MQLSHKNPKQNLLFSLHPKNIHLEMFQLDHLTITCHDIESTRSSTCFWVLRRTTHCRITHTTYTKENKQQEVCKLTVPFSSSFYELICQAAYKIHPLQTKVFGLRLKVHPANAKETLKNSCMARKQILQLVTKPCPMSCLNII